MMNVAALMGMGMAIIAIVGIIVIACYIIFSMAHMKALKAMGYDKAWLAWIPYGVWYACADAAAGDEDPVRLFDSFEVPSTVFKLWWIVPLVLNFVSFNSGLETMINFALNLVFLGSTYAKMYAILDHKTEKETQTIGAVSGIVPIVAVVKFLMK